jgi:hypothetical protein
MKEAFRIAIDHSSLDEHELALLMTEIKILDGRCLYHCLAANAFALAISPKEIGDALCKWH